MYYIEWNGNRQQEIYESIVCRWDEWNGMAVVLVFIRSLTSGISSSLLLCCIAGNLLAIWLIEII